MLKKFVWFGFIQVFRAMQIAVIANDSQWNELGNDFHKENVDWLTHTGTLKGFDAVIDLLFDGQSARIQTLKQCGATLIIVNAVAATLNEIDPGFIRINAWTGFLKNKIIEATGLNEEVKSKAVELFAGFNKSIEWLPDQPGFVTPRVIAMIINEAYYALEDHVSTKEDINTAMKSGTNYPFGPFEWGSEIGLEKIASLLLKLAENNLRYQPSKLLLDEARNFGTLI
jgi:3-hydroxybutyryl-CoA dehydrogenase